MNVVKLHPDAPLAPVEFSIAEWLGARDAIMSAVERLSGAYAEEDVVASLLARQSLLWRLGKSAAITEIVNYPRKRYLSVFAAGGELNEVKTIIAAAEIYAAANKCHGIRIEGRNGWLRWAKELGYDPLNTIAVKEF